MKIKKVLFGSAFLLAIGSSFAFKGDRLGGPATFKIPGNPNCLGGYFDQQHCYINGSGPQCTASPAPSITVPAFMPNSVYGPPCTVPWYQQP